jgi:hypothetical protein
MGKQEGLGSVAIGRLAFWMYQEPNIHYGILKADFHFKRIISKAFFRSQLFHQTLEMFSKPLANSHKTLTQRLAAFLLP